MKKNVNLQVVGFFGQSGAGKTTIIRNVTTPVNGKIILQNTGIIRYLFQKNDYYVNAVDLYTRIESTLSEMKPQEKNSKIDETYEKYIRSQFQLLNDFSTEIFLAYRENYVDKSILLVDRSPIDFYAITIGGLTFLQSKLNKPLSAHSALLLDLLKKTAETNTKNFFDAVIVTKPWQIIEKMSELEDGIRDQYLSEWYTGENWYSRLDDVNIDGVKTFEISESVKNLKSRAELVELYVTGI
jgi:hypothetical protein